MESGNDILATVLDAGRWDVDRVIEYSVIFRRESAYEATTGKVDQEATAVLLANNSLHYGRTADIERFFIAYDDDGATPIGVGFGSYGGSRNWSVGLGMWIEIPNFVPTIGGRRIVTYKDDIPLTSALDTRVFAHRGRSVLPWHTLELSPGGAHRLYVSTPNHLFDTINRNPHMPHADQEYGTRSFRMLVELPSQMYATAEDVSRVFPDESRPEMRSAVRSFAELFYNRSWIF